MFARWPELRRIEPWWFAGDGRAPSPPASSACGGCTASVLHVHGWYLIATSQLASSRLRAHRAGGRRLGGALQYRCSPRAACAAAAWPAASPRSASSAARPSWRCRCSRCRPWSARSDMESTLRRVALFGLGVLAVAARLRRPDARLVDHPLHWAGRGLDWIRGKVLRPPHAAPGHRRPPAGRARHRARRARRPLARGAGGRARPARPRFRRAAHGRVRHRRAS